MIVESFLEPGRLIALHEHKNDEIISWVPNGVMRHNDNINGPLSIDSDHLMVMNAGRSFFHSEETLSSDPPLRMLQIFVRPHSIDLDPAIQHRSIDTGPRNEWRHLFGPEDGTAPFYVRNTIDFYDIRLDAAQHASFPEMSGRSIYFYVFSGSVAVDGVRFDEGEQGLSTSSEALKLMSLTPSTLVAFLIDPSAAVTMQGTVGDNRKIPPPYLSRPLLQFLRWRDRWRSRRAAH